MQALSIYAGPRARALLASDGLPPDRVRVVAGAAGGPKGLILGPLDRFIFGHWLPRSQQPVDLLGASIGAWRMGTACLSDCVNAFERLERDYIAQHYEPEDGRKMPSPRQVSQAFGENLNAFYGGRIAEVINHPRYRVHIVTARGRHVLRREHRWATPLGYLGAFASNAVQRRALGAWLERVVFSTPGAAMPFHAHDLPTRQIDLTQANFQPALQASCSIPFVLEAVHDIPGAPRGAYWDGGITDYHLHLDYRAACAPRPTEPTQPQGVVLYPHFQKAVVPGWLDKGLKWRHGASAFLEDVVVVAPNPSWVATLPHGKLPDRTDFKRYGLDWQARARVWTAAVGEAQRLADEWAAWLDRPDMGRVTPL